MGRGEERESKRTAREYIFPLLAFLSFLFEVKDKPGGAAVWPSDCVRRLAVPHTGTPLITGAGLSLLDTKTPHTHPHTHHTCQHRHNEYLHICPCAYSNEENKDGGWRFLSTFRRSTHNYF